MRKVTIVKDDKGRRQLVDLGPVKPRGPKVHRSRIKVINTALIDACRRNDKRAVAELLRNGHVVTDWDKEALADMIERAIKFKRKQGRPRNLNLDHAVAIAKHLVRPVLQKAWKEQQSELRKQKLPYGIEDAIINSTVAYMEHLVDFDVANFDVAEKCMIKAGSVPVKAKTLRAAYHKSRKRRSK